MQFFILLAYLNNSGNISKWMNKKWLTLFENRIACICTQIYVYTHMWETVNKMKWNEIKQGCHISQTHAQRKIVHLCLIENELTRKYGMHGIHVRANSLEKWEIKWVKCWVRNRRMQHWALCCLERHVSHTQQTDSTTFNLFPVHSWEYCSILAANHLLVK